MELLGQDVLVVDDDLLLSKRVVSILERLGAEVTAAETLAAARQLLKSGIRFDFVLLDVNLPDGLGTDLLKSNSISPETSVIVITAHGGVGGAVEAMRLGAADYLVKPFETEELPLVLQRARRSRQATRLQEHRRNESKDQAFVFGESMALLQGQLQKILEADERMKENLPPILIQGETGTGKTALARWIHQQGLRSKSELVEVNCSAIPEALAESELFGHERGAFTDARASRMGLFEAARSGTLFLDELPSLSLALQAKVLTAIEDRRVRRVGGNKAIAIETRVIAATQKDLIELAASGQFREDLYHRLNLYRLTIPPLRERGDDIIRLAEWLLQRLCRKHRIPERHMSTAGKRRLLFYHWPGNVRELAHEVERALVFEEGQEIELLHLPVLDETRLSGKKPDWLRGDFRFPETGFSLHQAINSLVQMALEQTNGNVSAAARLLSMPRDFVRYRLGRKGRSESGP